jgi:hypothetical protein
MVERVIEVMPPGVETLSLLINFKPSKQRQNTSVPVATAREVLHILQNHYPERLGKALIINGTGSTLLFPLSLHTTIMCPITDVKLAEWPMTNWLPSSSSMGRLGLLQNHHPLH